MTGRAIILCLLVVATILAPIVRAWDWVGHRPGVQMAIAGLLGAVVLAEVVL